MQKNKCFLVTVQNSKWRKFVDLWGFETNSGYVNFWKQFFLSYSTYCCLSIDMIIDIDKQLIHFLKPNVILK